MGIFSKLKQSFEATKVSIEGWVAFAVCVAFTGIFLFMATVGDWRAGFDPACLRLANVYPSQFF